MSEPSSQKSSVIVTSSPPAPEPCSRGDGARKDSVGGSTTGKATADVVDASTRLHADPSGAALVRQRRAVGTEAAQRKAAAALTKKRLVATAASTVSAPPPPTEGAAAVPPRTAAAAAPAAAVSEEVGEVMVCVEVPVAPAPHSSGFATAAVAGGRLNLRMRGLTALPCLHAPDAPTLETAGADAAGASPASAHGSGDVLASHLHAVSLRQNAIRTLLTETTRAASLRDAPALLLPRSSPLQCYAHVSSLDLTQNALTSISGIDALRCLRSLRLACNQLTSLSPLWASPYVAELDVLDVSANLLTELLSEDDVRALEAHHVRVVTHPTQAQSTAGRTRSVKSGQYKTMRLRVCYASSNQLREVPSALYSMTQLADLRLNSNAIATVPEGFPSRVCLPNLERLDLSMNQLPETPPAAVEGTTHRRGSAAHKPATAPTPVATDAAATHVPARRQSRSTRSRSNSSVNGSTTAAPVPGRTSARSLSPPPRDVTSASNASVAPQPQAGRRERGQQQQQQQQQQPTVSPADGSSPKRKKPPLTPQAATPGTVPPGSTAEALNAVQCLAENVYCVDLSRWASVVRRCLESVLEPTPAPDTGVPSASGAPAVRVSLADVLDALSESLIGGSSANGPRPRQRLAGAARAVTLLQQCLPTCTLFFTEDTQNRSPPLLMLTGIAPAALVAPDEFLLLEVLALHLVSNCLSTARPIGGGGTTPPGCSTTPSPTPALVEQTGCGIAANSSQGPSQPQQSSANDPSAARTSSGARFARSGSSASRLLNFAFGLHVVHVLDATTAAPAGSSAASIALMWTYVAWRQRWEAAVGRRRFRHRNSFVCELRAGGTTTRRSHSRSALASPGDPLLANAAVPDAAAAGAPTARPAAATLLYPFPCPDTVPRAAEWRRLREYRPASYAAVPSPWEALYDGVLRANAPITAVPPLLSGAGSLAHHLRGQPVPLASLLMCAVDLPSTAPTAAVAAAAPRLNAGRKGRATARGGAGCSAPRTADIVGAAQRWRQRTCELWGRVEGEAAIIAAEQETQCALPVYERAEVRRSQRVATSCVCGVSCPVSPSGEEASEADDEADDEAGAGGPNFLCASQQQSGTGATTPRDAETPDAECGDELPDSTADVPKDTSVDRLEVFADEADIAAVGAEEDPACPGDDVATPAETEV